MPAFNILPDAERENLASYVIHLSLRGQVEFNLMQELLNKEAGEGLEDSAIGERAREWVTNLAGNWRDAENKLINPETPAPTGADLEASVKRGFRLFQKDGMGCMSCHNQARLSADFMWSVLDHAYPAKIAPSAKAVGNKTSQ